MIKKTLTVLCLSIFVFLTTRPRLGTAYLSVGYTPEKTCFTVSYQGDESSLKVTPLFVLPGEDVSVRVRSDDTQASLTIDNGWKHNGADKWSWKAPRKAGLYPATITETASGELMTLNVFVMVPYGKLQRDTLNGYRIGRYPRVSTAKLPTYALPRGFIEVTAENKDTMLTPHFKLSQFLCKQGGGYPKYVVLRERLVLKLETVLDHVNTEGIPANTFTVMSGYRTPFYNRQLKNVRLSRHMWGDAADIYINNDPTVDAMDDLNGDGKRDEQDARLLYEIVDQLSDKPALKRFMGGLGWYKPTGSHGPFVHVDARGTPAHWSSN